MNETEDAMQRHTTTPALLTELDKTLVMIETAYRNRDAEYAHAMEDELTRHVLAAAIERKTNHRIMLRRLLDHLERADRYHPRWAA